MTATIQVGDLIKASQKGFQGAERESKYFVVKRVLGSEVYVSDIDGSVEIEVFEDKGVFRILDYTVDYRIPKDHPNIVHLLFITQRQHYGDDEIPQQILAARSWDLLVAKFEKYLQEHRDWEEHLEDEDFNEAFDDLIGKMRQHEIPTPELMSAYILGYRIVNNSDTNFW